MDDDDDGDFYDTISTNSHALINSKRSKNKDYISLSRNTIYHSAVDLETMEMSAVSGNHHQNKVSSRTVTCYTQWRDRTWRSFSHDDLCVDFVLAYDQTSSDPDRLKKRETFEQNLEKIGLILEKEERQKIHFVKIHAPREILCTYTEILKLRMPIKDEDVLKPSQNFVKGVIKKCMSCLKVTLDTKKFPPQQYRLTAEFSKDKYYLFDTESPNFFNDLVRITVVSYILHREKFGDEDQDKGIRKLLSDDVYKAAYPLHDGDVSHVGSQRQLLADEWASVSKWVKYQPLDEIKDYFGVRFALYFAWLGFYTHMLIPAAIVGLLCLLYGWLTYGTDTMSHDICNLDIVMCPLCDNVCKYWKLNESCTFSRIAHFIDNPSTIFFAVFMSIWGAIYLELWKRYSVEITHRWGMTGFDLQAEPPRPEYLTRLANAKKKRLNIITLLKEPVVPFWKVKLPSLIFSFAVVLLWVCIAVAIVFSIVLYRMALLTSSALYEDRTSYRIYVVPVTAGLINLICIVILNFIYSTLAEWLTEMELQRTQTEHDDSLALKIYMFQAVNYYSSIFYIAFLKGKFVGYPAKYNRVFGYRQEECNPGGCLMELTIQLAIIMIGNQAINAFLEMGVPLVLKIYNSIRITAGMKKANSDDEIVSCNQWTEDYKLSDPESKGLFTEYLEMVLQYGFVTIFVTAFPLAPLFALINNIFEMRLDAKKFIKYFRRPVPQRVKNIGVWMPIMEIVGRVSVVSNAFIIAFSSNFIPKLVYIMKYSHSRTDSGYLQYSLSYFDTRDFKNDTAPNENPWNVTTCRYAEYRNPPDHEFKYKRPVDYWHILAARLAFIVVYQNVVSFIIMAIQWAIPDIPRKLNDQIKREAYKTNETIIKHETERAKEKMKSRKNRDSLLSSNTVYGDVNGDAVQIDDVGLHRRNQFTTATTEL